MARYQKGQGGRPKGARNKRTVEFMAVLEKARFCPASALMEIYQSAMTDYQYYSELLRSNRISPMEDNSHKNLRIAADMAKELSSYAYPKLKSVEQTKNIDDGRPYKDLTDEELAEQRKKYENSSS